MQSSQPFTTRPETPDVTSCNPSASGVLQVEKPPRPGVVQYNFLHTLLNRGALELEGLCPGYLEALQQAGAHKGYFHRDSKFGTPK